jgi:hypothetical protein
MRFFLITGFVFSKIRINPYILALTIPFFSTITSGHPIFFKSVLIAAELLMNVAVLDYLIRRSGNHPFFALLSSIIVSKIFYYISKYIFIQFGIITGGLVSTNIIIQLIVILAISTLFSLYLLHNKVQK